MTSILTNSSAMTALKVLRQNDMALGATQERISTGLKVNSAKDDASTWAISQGIKSDVSAFKTMSEGLTMAGNAIKVAAGAASSINDQITLIKQKIAQAKQPGADKTAIQDAIDSALSQISSITSNASFNGTNLVDNTNVLKVLASTSRDATGAATANYIDVQGIDLNIANGGGLAMLNGLKVTRDAVVTGPSTPQSVVTIAGGNAAAASTLTLNYQTADGKAKSVALNVASGASPAAVGQNFLDTFGDQLKADGLELVNNAGVLTVTSTKPGARVVSAATTDATQTVAQVNRVSLSFTDATLNDGDEFRVSVNIGGTVQTTVLRVGGATALLGKDADGNTLVGLNKAAMTDAATIASTINTALGLVTWNHDGDDGTTPEVGLFTGAATAGTDLDLDNSVAGTITITSADSADFFTDITLPDANYADLLDRVESAAKVAIGAAQAFGTAQSQTESQQSFLNNLIDSLETGVGALVDADITAESARLNALQTQQQLATQSLSIANQSTQSILSLFK
jgi:flagellin